MSTYPVNLSLRPYIRYLPDQGNIGCCSACATLLAAEMIMTMEGVKVNFSRLYLYYMTRKLQGRLGEEGAELSKTLEALSARGVCEDNYWPLAQNRAELEPDAVAMFNAAKYVSCQYRSVEVDQYKEYLNNGIPIIVGMFTGKKFWQLSGNLAEQAYKPINNTDNMLSKGHAVTIVGYDDELGSGSWIIANSLGPGWGFQGYAAIPYECSKEIGESYCITNFAGKTAGKKFLRD